MFPFDPADLPQLTTRKALIAVDFQNDFVGVRGDAALPVCEPGGFVSRAVALAEAFQNGVGDVVWVQSCFSQARPADHIVTSDGAPPASRRRTKGNDVPPPPAEDQGPPDAEAFLSHEEPACVRASSSGADMAPAVRSAVGKGDTVLTKSHYSAFEGTPLLRLLRAKMVMEVFICGSLANAGVYATALDAAGHGMAITVVEDCCGYRLESRQIRAMRGLMELTGCEFATCQQVIEATRPKKKGPGGPSAGHGPQKDTRGKPARSHEMSESVPQGQGSRSPDIVRSLTHLTLVPDSRSQAVAEKGAGGSTAADSPDMASAPNAAEAQATTSNKCKEEEEDEEGEDGDDDEDDDDDDDGDEDDESDGKEKEEAEADGDDAGLKLASGASLAGSGPTPGRRQANASPSLSPPPTDKAMQSSKDGPSARRRDDASGSKMAPDDQGKPAATLDEASDDEQRKPQSTMTGLCEGDTSIIFDLVPPAVEAGIFDRLRDEVQWQRMCHQGGEVPRLVAVQGVVSARDGSVPVYRHPSDEAPALLPFSPTVLAVRHAVEDRLGHAVNHVLVQFYRDGNDYISEHSDKTLDIAKDSYVANVSFGAERTIVFRTKRPARIPGSSSSSSPPPPPPPSSSPSQRRVQRAALPHNSLCKMGLETNMKWLHAIRADRRADGDKTPAQLAHGGARISLTFRRIATFLDADAALIWGQGASAKTRDAARPVVNGQGPEAVAMLRAFGAENHASDFDWHAHYGRGFDVLHIRAAPRFFASPDDAVVNMRIALMLAEHAVGHAKGSMGATSRPPQKTAADAPRPPAAVRFVDNDADRTAVDGAVAIMLYLDSRHAAPDSPRPSRAELAARFTLFQRALDLHAMLPPPARQAPTPLSKAVLRELAAWDVSAADAQGRFLAGPAMSLADFALWPVLHALVDEHGSASVFDGLDSLRQYYHAVAARDSAKKVAGRDSSPQRLPH